MSLPILYSFRRCPYAMRARLAIKVAGCRVQLREILLKNKPESMLQASSKGTVPVLVMPQSASIEVLDESLDIMLWALERCDPQGWLSPECGDLAEMCALITRFDDVCPSGFKYHLDRYKYAPRYLEAEGYEQQAVGEFACYHRQQAETLLLLLERRLEGAKWSFGGSPALADMAILPFVRQFAATDQAYWQAAPFPRVRIWLADFLSSELFVGVMKKYPLWSEQQGAGVEFPEGGD